MLVEDLILEVRDPNLRRAGIVDLNDATLEIRSEFCNVGTWKLTVVSDHPTVKTLRTPGSGITLRAHGKVFFSGRVDERTAKATFDDPEGTITFEGISDDHILGDRLAYPVPTSATMEGQRAAANDVREGKLETVMHSFVRANIGPGAPAIRQHPQLDMGPDLGRGPNVKRSTRFAKLGNLLRDIVVLGDLGFRVIQRGTRLAFETYAVTDRTKTIRMDVWNGTLESYEATSIGASVTHVIVAGQEEGVDRQLIERTSAESLAQEALWKRRIELFLDQRHTDDEAELAQAGDEELAKNGVGQSAIKFVPMDDGTMEFLRDWFVGDRVTAVVEDREIPAIVTAAVLRVDQDGVAVMCALGDINGTSSTEGFISRTESRLSALERAASSSSDGSGTPGAEMPTGSMTMWAGSTAPSGWILCQGQAISRSTYARLFAAIGTSYGTGDGSTTFNLPDMRSRVPVGVDASDSQFSAPGRTGGAKTHTLTVGEMPSHTHTQNAHAHTASTGSAGAHTHDVKFHSIADSTIALGSLSSGYFFLRRNHAEDGSLGTNPAAMSAGAHTHSVTVSSATATNQNTGGGQAHNNLQPFATVHYIIKT